MLPFDFTAKQLAAFMLAGPGSLVADFYGDWGDGPDPASLRHIDPDSKASTAIVQAYAVYRETEKIVGPYPLELDKEAERARKEYNKENMLANKRAKVFEKSLINKPGSEQSKLRRDGSVASTVALNIAMKAKATEATAAQKAWLKAMVLHLLQPTPAENPATPDNRVESNGSPAHETKAQRQDRRLKACIDAGLPMNDKVALIRLPDGVGAVAEREQVTRQAFSADVKAALKRRESAKKEGRILHSA